MDAAPKARHAPAPESARPGGRTARVRADVLAAVEAELAEHGYDGLTVDGVAARSGVHRTTVYRRWHTVDGLLIDLLAMGADDTWVPTETGSLEGDLVELNREIHGSLATSPSLTVAVIAASYRTAEAAAALHDFWKDRYERSAIVVTRAIERGEIPPGTDAHRVLLTATAPLFHQLALLRQELTAADAERYARDAAESAKAGILRTYP
ncbi:TetR/AcrR family transcriptional regulator [Streptomyces sp. SID13031]|uniref:TetR/AcrR family transcriptional regulator n=1 Tax=Streptomyces sp. SID13031 TaxID=2706046 RepID=UPI0013C642A3|nr:TetR/AcrR family transcriptional regulator [Streptomyces sp. SID13031]NEA36441.1 TetR/AcrR family transcriptional regulator [Streptomyces sp. SID13031]